MNRKVYLASAAILSTAAAAAFAQYTPGTGVPYVPAPAGPAPAVPAQPAYSWQAPAAPAPQGAPLEQVAPGAVQVIQAPPEIVIPQLNDAQLNDITSSVALYPDPLVATLLPAATYVQEVTYADKWLAQHPGADEAVIASLPVHPSVQTLMHYPTVLAMLANNVDWTQALGVAFQYQPNNVMEAIQRWRLTAVTYGTLYSTPQLSVVRQANIITILPPPTAQVIYVPVYDPAVVYVRPLRPVRDAITFTTVGISLSFIHNDVDWHDHVVHVPVHPHMDVVEHAPGHDVVVHDVVVADHDRHDGPPERRAFVHDDAKPVIAYPDRIVTPTDHRVVEVPPGRGRGDLGRGRSDVIHDDGRGAPHPDPLSPAATGPAGATPGRGRNVNPNNPPGTPF